MSVYDVVIVGAGPIGCNTAYLLSDKGFKVLLIEEDEEVGRDVICTGVIGRETFERFDIPTDSVLSKIRKLHFFSPSDILLEYVHHDDIAYVIDRDILDKQLLELATKSGVFFKPGVRVERIRQSGDKEVILESDDGTYRGKIAVIATGVDYRLQKLAGLGTVKDFLIGAQVEIPSQVVAHCSSDSAVEIYTGHEIAPASFAWIVPSGKKSKIGVLVEKDARMYLSKFLRKRSLEKITHNYEPREKPIAYGTIERSFKGRILAVGEAAGQVKTTTGGGIFYGLLCSELVAVLIAKSFHRGDIRYLKEYERKWKKMLGNEIIIGKKLRELARRLDDKTLDRLFCRVKESDVIIEGIIRHMSFEFHSGLIRFLLMAFEKYLK